MTAVDVDALDKLREAATAGPWWAWDRGVGWHIVTEDPATVGRGSVPVTLPEGMRTDLARGEDAALIVAAVNALPDLLAEVRRGRALREAVEGLADDLDSYVAARGKPKTGTYDGGLNRAQAATATDLRVILDPT